jgi:hypothetical protein
MALVTFILVSCLSVGIGDDFSPEVISNNGVKCILLSLMELFLYKIGKIQMKL